MLQSSQNDAHAIHGVVVSLYIMKPASQSLQEVPLLHVVQLVGQSTQRLVVESLYQPEVQVPHIVLSV